MLRIRYDLEDWRERLAPLADRLGIDDATHDALAEQLKEGTLDLLRNAGQSFTRAYRQCVGNYVLVQGGATDAEILLFTLCLEIALDELASQVRAGRWDSATSESEHVE